MLGISTWECQCFAGKRNYKLQITNYTKHVQAQAPKIEEFFFKNKILIEKMSQNILQTSAEK